MDNNNLLNVFGYDVVVPSGYNANYISDVNSVVPDNTIELVQVRVSSGDLFSLFIKHKCVLTLKVNATQEDIAMMHKIISAI